jgi:hypothetical protein
MNRKIQITKTIAILTLSAILLAGTPAEAGRKPNFGLYGSKYQLVVGSNADFLVHPTGEYLDVNDYKWKEIRDRYTPTVRKTDDMDSEVLSMAEQGYVMIGYAAFSSSEAAPHPLQDAVAPGAAAGTRLGMKMRGYDPNMDMKGDPVHAGIMANAAVVVIQENYAFSRLETRMARIQTDDGKETTQMSGDREDSYRSAYGGRSDGSYNTKGSMKSRGDWDENHQDVSASAGSDGGSVEGSAGQSEGGSRDRTDYNERTTFNSRYSGGSAGMSQGSYNDKISHSSQHWATTLVDKHVNHYDYMVTFWKKAKPEMFRLGVFTKPVPREIMRAIGTRHGRMIRTVVGGTPAFDSDLWDGDILLAVNEEPIRGNDGLNNLLAAKNGQEVTLTVWREGEMFDLPVLLNNVR